GNYYLVDPTTTADITPLAIEVTADDQSKVYGDADPALTYQITSGSLLGSDSFTGALSHAAGENVGFYAIQQGTLVVDDGNSGNNYSLTFVDGELEITPRAITVTADDQSRAYGDADPTLTHQITSGSLAFDDSFTGTLSRVAGENVGFYTIQQGTLAIDDGNGGANYTLTFVDGELEITPRAITVTADGQSKVYGDADPALTYQITSGSLVGSDNFTGAMTRVAGENAGLYAIQQGTLAIDDGNGGANYTLTFVDGELVIMPKALTITASDRSKTYNDTVTFAGTEFTATGLINADTVTSVTLTSAGAAAGATVAGGPYSIVPSAAIGTGLGNYTITYVNGALTVSPAALTITATAASKTYGDTVTFAGTEFMATGLLGSDSVAGVTLTSAGAAATAAAGTHAIVPSAATGTGLANYEITYVDGTLTVVPKALTITAADRTKTYGTAVTFAGTEFTVAGLVNADTITSVTLTSTGAPATAAVAGSPYSIVPSAAVGTGLDNYTISYVSGALTVNKSGTTCSVTSSTATTKRGKSVTFTATVTGTGATGTMTFQDGGTVLGTSTLRDGTATYSTSNLSAGSHFITTVYSGDSDFAGSSSPAITHTVKKVTGVNWGLIFGIIAAGILVSLFFFFLIFFARRRKKDEGQQKA
ncbi:MAG: Ig-like domain repeat protein, partial [Dehalococcoidia bacterium]|nr:Ig-like domain repeat protein [Dehalococcoidia bacterium]